MSRATLHLMLMRITILFSFFCLSTQATTPDFKFFRTWKEAVEAYMPLEKIYQSSRGGGVREVLERSDESYEKFKNYLMPVYQTFQKLYPEVAAIQNFPKLIILKDSGSNAFVGSLDDDGLTPFYVGATSGFLKKHNKKEIQSVFAHELVHLLLQGKKDGTSFPKEITYQTTKKESFNFSSQIKNNEDLEEKMNEWLALKYYIGPVDLGDEDYFIVEKSTTSESLYRLFSTQINRNSSCFKESIFDDNAALSVDVMMITNRYGLVDNRSYTFKEDLEEAKRSREKVKIQAENCLSSLRKDYYTLMSDSFGLSPQAIKDYFEPRFGPQRREVHQEVLKAFQENSFYEAYLLIGESFRKRMRKIEAGIDVESVRVVTKEDHADEVAIHILKEMELSVRHLNDFLKADTKCDSYNDFYKDYSLASSQHPNTCWRVKRNQALWELLNQS